MSITAVRRRSRFGRVLRGALPLLAATGLAACSGGEGRTLTFPVQGAVKYRGEAAPGAFVVFHPVSPRPGEPVRPTATVGPDGSFRVTSDDGDGAPAGEYAVTVDYYKPVGTGSDLQRGPNVIPPRYGRPETTPLKVTVRAGANTIEPFAITK